MFCLRASVTHQPRSHLCTKAAEVDFIGSGVREVCSPARLPFNFVIQMTVKIASYSSENNNIAICSNNKLSEYTVSALLSGECLGKLHVCMLVSDMGECRSAWNGFFAFSS